MATLVTYPDAGSGATTADCLFNTSIFDEAWATLQARASASTADNATAFGNIAIASSGTSNQWARLTRDILTFDTSAVGGLGIISAILSLASGGKADNYTPAIGMDIAIYSATPASNNSIVGADYSRIGTTAFATIANAAWPGSGTYADFALNAAGLANIDGSGISRFGVRNANYDVAVVAPTWTSGATASLDFKLADTAGTTTDPKLTVTYGPFTAAPTDYSQFPKPRLRAE